MKYKLTVSLALILSFYLFNSCNETRELPDVIIESADSYSQLKTGNYWVYQRIQKNSQTGEEIILSSLDSIYVENDTLIGIHNYFILKGSWFGIPFKRILRNKKEKLVDPHGNILFSAEMKFDTIDIIHTVSNFLIDSIYVVLSSKSFNITTPAGSFVSDRQYERIFFLNENVPPDLRIRPEKEFYSKNIGVVKYTSYYANSPMDVEMRLLRYHVQ